MWNAWIPVGLQEVAKSTQQSLKKKQLSSQEQVKGNLNGSPHLSLKENFEVLILNNKIAPNGRTVAMGKKDWFGWVFMRIKNQDIKIPLKDLNKKYYFPIKLFNYLHLLYSKLKDCLHKKAKFNNNNQ